MDNSESKPAPKTNEQSTRIWNLLTMIVVLVACVLIYVFLTIFINPGSSLNPLKPAPTAVIPRTDTPTNTLIPLPPTWTPTPTREPSATRTKAPSQTPIPPTETLTPTETLAETLTETPSETPGGDTPTPTLSPTPMPATAEITYQAGTSTHPNSACKWMGVGGKVLDPAGEPLKFQTLKLGGSLNGTAVDRQMLSGDVPAYGESGFEFLLGNTPVASSQALWIQLFDNTGAPLTQPIFFDTFADCDKNLVMIVFTRTQ